MALDTIVQPWVERFYYKGVGLQLPSKLPKSENDYNIAFRRNMLKPMQEVFGTEYNADLVPEFLQAYRKVCTITPFHILPELHVPDGVSGSWQDRLAAAVNAYIDGAEKWWCMTKGGQLFKAYFKGDRILGQFPYKVGPIIPIESLAATEAPGYISNLLTKNPMTLTDTECESMRRIFNIDTTYNSKLSKVQIEVFTEGHFEVQTISPMGTLFPCSDLRKLWSLLPVNNPYASKHEQAYYYCLEHPTEYPQLLAYLTEVFNSIEQSDDISLTSGEITVTDTPPTDVNGTVFTSIGSYLQACVDADEICSHWTVQSIIDWYADKIPYPADFNPNDMEPSQENDAYFAKQLRLAMKYIDMPNVGDVSLNDAAVLCETGEDPKTHVYNSVQELLDEGIQLSPECIEEITGNVDKRLHKLGFNVETVEAIENGPKALNSWLAKASNLISAVEQNYVSPIAAAVKQIISTNEVPKPSPITDVWTLLSTDYIAVELRDKLVTPELLQSKCHIPAELVDAYTGALWNDSATANSFPIAEVVLKSIGFSDEDTATILSGELPLADSVTVEEVVRDYNPFTDVINSANVVEKQKVLLRLLEDLAGFDSGTAYLMSDVNNTVPLVQKLLKDLPEDTCNAIIQEKMSAPEAESIWSYKVGMYLMSKMKMELKRGDALSLQESTKIRQGFVPLFKKLVTVFAAREDKEFTLRILRPLLDNEEASQTVKDIVADTIQYAENLEF